MWPDETFASSSIDSLDPLRKTVVRNSSNNLSAIQRSDQKLWFVLVITLV